MALVWIKDVDRIKREGGLEIETSGYEEGSFYDNRFGDSFVTDMSDYINESSGPHEVNPTLDTDGFRPPYRVSFNGFNWYRDWIKMYLPDGIRIKRRL